MAARRGFALVLVVGVMGLLLLAGAGLLQIAAQAASTASAIGSSIRCRLAAASGMDYAAARLLREPYPRYVDTPESRADDWTYRERIEVPLPAAANVSYSHGEPWRNAVPHVPGLDDDGDGRTDELAEGEGIRQSGEAPAVDLDGDGVFSAWSGRIRGEASPFGLRFSIRIEGSEGKIPLNAGAVWPEDRYGLLPTGGNGRPDHNDPAIPCHKAWVRLLNSLGAILHDRDPLHFHTRCRKEPTGVPENPGEPVWISTLGADLLARRPAQGYRSIEEVRDAMLDAGYDLAEVQAAAPFLEAGPPRALEGTSRCLSKDGGMAAVGQRVPLPAFAPIRLSTAPPEVLRAAWMYLMGELPGSWVGGESAVWATTPYSRTGDPDLPGTLVFGDLGWWREIGWWPPFPRGFYILLYPDEAKSLAELAAGFRQRGNALLWRDLYRTIAESAATLFRKDLLDLAGHPENQRAWAQAKTDLAFQSVCMDPHPLGGAVGGWGCPTWAAWGLDRDGDPADGVVQPDASFGFGQAVVPRSPPWKSMKGASDPYAFFSYYDAMVSCATPGFSLVPPDAFWVECLGEAVRSGARGATVRARIRPIETIELASQEDFECLAGSYFQAKGQSLYAARGIWIADPAPELRREPRTDASVSPARTYPSTVTLPRPSRRLQAGTAESALRPDWYGYSPVYGAVGLAARKTGPWGALQYWPFQEDLDWDPRPFTPGSSQGTDGWSEAAGGLPRLKMPILLSGGADTDGYGTPHLLGNGCWSPPPGVTFECPGFSPGSFVGNVSLEFWGGPASGLMLSGDNAYHISLWLQRETSAGPDPVFGTSLCLSVHWRTDLGPLSQVFPPMLIEDRPLPPLSRRVSWMYHVVMTIERRFDNSTLFRFFVNGMDRDPVAGLPLAQVFDPFTANGANHNGNMKGTVNENLSFVGLDEIRIYNSLLDQGQAKERYEKERFVRSGAFTSPLYAFDRPVQLVGGSWTGLVPPGLFRTSDPADPVRKPPALDPDTGRPAPLDPFRVKVTAYRSDPRLPGHPSPAAGTEADLPPDGLAALAGLGEVRSFQYRVEMDCSLSTGILNDTPVFESIWISFRRGGEPAAWTAWSVR